MNTLARRRALSVPLSLLMAILMVLSTAVMPQTADSHRTHAAYFSDVQGHWASDYITQAVNYGFVSGYPDATFRPDASITRAEFTRMLNSALGNTTTREIGFWDTIIGEWYYPEVQKGVAAGFITGRSETQFAPSATITRQEAAVMIGRVVPSYGTESIQKDLASFGDGDTVADWAVPALRKMCGKSYIGAYDDGDLHPAASLTRAQAAKILSDLVRRERIDANNKRVVAHDGPDLTVQGTIFSNRMTVDASASDDLLTFSNCTVLGDFIVEGGASGVNSGIELLNCRIPHVTMTAGQEEVRIYAKGETTVKNLTVSDNVTVENGYLKGSGDYGRGFETVTIKGKTQAHLIGSFDTVRITGSDVELTVETGKVQNLIIASGCRDVRVDTAEDAELYSVEANGPGTVFSGKGRITKLAANADSITYETEPARITTGSSVGIGPAIAVDYERSLTITPVPADGATKVSTSEDIVLKFSSVVHMTDFDQSSRLTDRQAQNIINVRKGSSGGPSIDFTASVADDGKSVALTPLEPLKMDTTYYIRIAKGELTDYYGHKNDLFLSSFTTGLASYDVQFDPEPGATLVSLTAIPTITFGQPVMRYSSGSTSITSQYLRDIAITLQKMGPNEVNRANVNFTAEIDPSNRQITIKPSQKLEEETTYYITINPHTLASQSDSKPVDERTSSFSTVSNSMSNRVATPVDYDKAKLSFKALQSGTAYGIIFRQDELQSDQPTSIKIRDHSYNSSVSANAGHYDSVKVTKGSTYTMNFSGLEPNTAYYIYMVLYEDADTCGSVFCEPVSTSRRLPSLTGLNIRAQADGQEDAKDVLATADASGNIEYYIGPEETSLDITPYIAGKDESISYEISFTSSTIGTRIDKTTDPINLRIDSAEHIGAATNIGTITVDVKSTDPAYGIKTYKVYVHRLIPQVKTVAITGSGGGKVNTFTDEAYVTNDSYGPTPISLAGLSTENVMLTASLADGIKYRVDKYSDGSWEIISSSDYTSDQKFLGKKGVLVDECKPDDVDTEGKSIVYRIRSKCTLYGSTPTNGSQDYEETSYVKVMFVY